MIEIVPASGEINNDLPGITQLPNSETMPMACKAKASMLFVAKHLREWSNSGKTTQRE